MSERTEIQLRVHELLKSLHIRWDEKFNNQRLDKYRKGVRKNKGRPDDYVFMTNGKLLCLEYKIGYNKLTK